MLNSLQGHRGHEATKRTHSHYAEWVDVDFANQTTNIHRHQQAHHPLAPTMSPSVSRQGFVDAKHHSWTPGRWMTVRVVGGESNVLCI